MWMSSSTLVLCWLAGVLRVTLAVPGLMVGSGRPALGLLLLLVGLGWQVLGLLLLASGFDGRGLVAATCGSVKEEIPS